MSTYTKDMTVGSPAKLILSFSFPVFLSQVFQQLYNTADALIVGRFLGDEALAAVSSSGTLIFLIISFFVGMSMGAGVVISRNFGAGEYDAVSRGIHTNLILAVASGLFLSVIGVVFSPTFLRWMGTAPEVLPDAIVYFRYIFAGALASVLYNTCTGIMNALGDSRRPLYYLIFSSVLNIILDVLLIGGFGFGVWAAAAATVVSQAASVVLCLVHLCKKGTVYQVELKKLRVDWQMLRSIFHNGVPSGIQNSVIGFANVIVQSNINSFGKDAMAAYGAYSKIEGFGFLPITSFTMAITTFISQNLGARQYDRAKKGARFGVLSAVLCAELIGVIIWLGAPTFIGWFTETPEVIAIGTQEARTITLFYFLLAFSHAISAVCRGSGRPVTSTGVMLLCWCVIRITYITVAMHLIHEIQYIYWAYPITWGLSSVLFAGIYFFSDWTHGFERHTAHRKRPASQA